MNRPAFSSAHSLPNDNVDLARQRTDSFAHDEPSAVLAGIRGRRVLTADGIGAAHLAFDGEHIGSSDLGHAHGAGFDAGDMLVLPGIVDLHGDAFERSVMPRPGVSFPYDQALHDVDRQLLANGITTEFHGVTLSWEGGLRGAPYAERMFDALSQHSADLGAQHYIHLRFETANVAAVGLACEWINSGKVRFLALNDHLPTMAKRLGDDRKLLQYADRAECDIDTFSARIRQALGSAGEIPEAMHHLVDCALRAGLRVASHDDPSVAVRQAYNELGCSVAEFPLTIEAARAARSLGNALVFGAPNVVRGRSHTHAPNATEMVRAGLCDVLASDYYYPAPLSAVMRLVADGVLPLEQAWNLVSANPARAAGLEDRGELSAGMRADAIVVDDRKPGVPIVRAAIVGGQVRYANPYTTHMSARSMVNAAAKATGAVGVDRAADGAAGVSAYAADNGAAFADQR